MSKSQRSIETDPRPYDVILIDGHPATILSVSEESNDVLLHHQQTTISRHRNFWPEIVRNAEVLWLAPDPEPALPPHTPPSENNEPDAEPKANKPADKPAKTKH